MRIKKLAGLLVLLGSFLPLGSQASPQAVSDPNKPSIEHTKMLAGLYRQDNGQDYWYFYEDHGKLSGRAAWGTFEFEAIHDRVFQVKQWAGSAFYFEVDAKGDALGFTEQKDGKIAKRFASFPLSIPVAQAKGKGSIEGTWRADFEAKRTKKPQQLVLYIKKGENGSLNVTWDWPQINAIGRKEITAGFHDGTLDFAFLDKALFFGRLTQDGSQIVGRRAGNWWESFTSNADYGIDDAPIAFVRLHKDPEYRRPQEPHPPFPYNAEEVKFENKKAGVIFSGTFTYPKSKGPFQTVLIPTRWTRNEDLKFLVLADHLTRLGIAVLRVDGRGMGGTSKGLVASPTDPDYADDALEAVEFLKGRPEVDPKKIGLLGHSEGARIVTSAATRSKDISFVVLLGAAGISGGQNFLQQNLTMMAVDGEPKEKIVLHRKLIEKVLAGVGKYKELEDAEFRKRLTAICADEMKKFSNDELERAEGKPSLDIFAGSIVKFFSSSWGRYYALNEPTETIAKLKCPVLALTGEKDLQVAPKENLAAIARALKNGKNQDFTVKELPDLNHNFQTCKTGEWAEYSLLEETFAPGALDMIASWILKHNI